MLGLDENKHDSNCNSTRSKLPRVHISVAFGEFLLFQENPTLMMHICSIMFNPFHFQLSRPQPQKPFPLGVRSCLRSTGRRPGKAERPLSAKGGIERGT